MYALMYAPQSNLEVIIGFKSEKMAWDFQSRFLSCGSCELADFLDDWNENETYTEDCFSNSCSAEYFVVEESELEPNEEQIHYKDWVLKYRPLRIGKPKNATTSVEKPIIGGCFPV